ncbi:DUF2243 domain-containing protein [Halegenticoccus tardaugens]|uniref:DUF2243 domain-containing protein n=1 Tax=Halegenticoccus tardaugens TaxID=2071624 RepID=UPI00100BDA31|nr:DUF2243 domain-containing protein [Halegenticoccus tardaugens]
MTDRSPPAPDGPGPEPLRKALLAAGVFGFGFSGLIDVLVLHHVLQLHHLLSNVYDPATLSGLRVNILADGLFSVGMLIVAGVGAGLVWRAERRSVAPLPTRPLVGSAVIGLGAFDLFDVVVNHTILDLHSATDGPGYYDPHWAVVSLLIIGAGAYVYRTGLARTRGGTEER